MHDNNVAVRSWWPVQQQPCDARAPVLLADGAAASLLLVLEQPALLGHYSQCPLVPCPTSGYCAPLVSIVAAPMTDSSPAARDSAAPFSHYADIDFHRVLAADDSHHYSRFLDSQPYPASTPPFIGVGPRTASHPALGDLGVVYDSGDAEGGVDTMWKAWQRTVRLTPHAPCVGSRPFVLTSDSSGGATPSSTASYAVSDEDGLPLRADFVWSDFAAVDQQASNVGRGLSTLVEAGQALNCAVLSSCRAEMMPTFVGLRSQCIPIIALSSRMGDVAVRAILNRVSCNVLFASHDALLAVEPLIANRELISLTHVVLYDQSDARMNNVHEQLTQSTRDRYSSKYGLRVLGFEELMQLGARHPDATLSGLAAHRDSIASIVFTSGTTGAPKGVMVREESLIVPLNQLFGASPPHGVQPGVSLLSWDPHISFIGNVMVGAAQGRASAFHSGPATRWREDVQLCRPTGLTVPVSVTELLRDSLLHIIRARLTSEERQQLWQYYLDVSAKFNEAGKLQLQPAPAAVGRVKQLAGLDRCQIILAGAVPFPPSLQHFLRVVTGIPVKELCGATECGIVVTVVPFEDDTLGSIGIPLPGAECRLVDVAEMGYLSTDQPCPRGELYVKSPSVSAGYYRDEELTRQVLPAGKDSWYPTGDICRLNANGTLTIVDRKSQLFKPRCIGTFVSPDFLQAMYLREQRIRQLFVYGSSFHHAILAVVVPDRDRLLQWMADRGYVTQLADGSGADTAQLWKQYLAVGRRHEAEIKLVMRQALAAQESGMIVHDKVADFLLEFDVDAQGLAFTADNGMLVRAYGTQHTALGTTQHAATSRPTHSCRLSLIAVLHRPEAPRSCREERSPATTRTSCRGCTYNWERAYNQRKRGEAAGAGLRLSVSVVCCLLALFTRALLYSLS